MADVAPDYVRDKQHRQQNADGGENQVQQVGVFRRKARSEQMLDFLN